MEERERKREREGGREEREKEGGVNFCTLLGIFSCYLGIFLLLFFFFLCCCFLICT